MKECFSILNVLLAIWTNVQRIWYEIACLVSFLSLDSTPGFALPPCLLSQFS